MSVHLDSRYDAGPAWHAAVAAFERSGEDAWCGPVAPSDRLTYAGWAIWFAEYWRVAPPAAEGLICDALDIPVGNVVYRAPRPDGDVLALAHHRGLLARGARVRRVIAMTVEFARPPRLGDYLRERFRLSRSIAAHARLFGLVLPAIVLFRWYGAALAKPRYVIRAIAALPLLLLFALVQGAGECAAQYTNKSR